MVEMPQKLLDLKPKQEKSDAGKEKGSAPPLYESDAPPPPPPDPIKTSMPAPQWSAANLYSDHDQVIGPVRLQVLGWEPAPGATEDMPLTPKGGVGPQTPRTGQDGATTPRIQGVGPQTPRTGQDGATTP